MFYAFDLLWLDGVDLRNDPLLVRKNCLRDLIVSSNCSRIIYTQHIEHDGKRFFKEVCALDLEGVVAKWKLGIYKDNGTGWLKIKNHACSQAEGRHELLSGGKSSKG